MGSKKRSHSGGSLWGRIGAPLLMLTVLIVLVGLVPISHPSLSRRVERELSHFLNVDTLTCESVVITLLRGITLSNLQLKQPLPDGSIVAVSAEEVRIVYRPLGIIRHGRTLSPSLRRLTGRIAVSSTGKHPITTGIKNVMGSRDAQVLTAFRSVAIRSLSFSLRTRRGSNIMRGDQLDITLSVDPQPPIALRARLRAPTLVLADRKVDKPRLLLFVSESSLQIKRLEGKLANGTIEATADVALGANAIRSGAVRVRNLDLRKLYESKPRRIGQIKGSADVSLELVPTIIDPDSVRAQGRVDIKNLTLDSIPLLNTMVISSALPFLTRTDFDHMGGQISLTREGIVCDTIRGRGEPLDVSLTGRFQFPNRLDFDVVGTLGAPVKDSVAPIVWDAMHPAPQDARSFRCTVTGTFDYPRVMLDRTLRRRAVRNLLDSIRANLRGSPKTED